MRRIERSAIIEARPDDLFAIVDDIESYPSFLPWCLEAQVSARTPEVTLARLTIGWKAVRQSFTTENRKRRPEAIDLVLVEGPFRRFESGWRFRALGGSATSLSFFLECEFRTRALALVLEPLFERVADTIVEAFVQRAAVRGTDRAR